MSNKLADFVGMSPEELVAFVKGPIELEQLASYTKEQIGVFMYLIMMREKALKAQVKQIGANKDLLKTVLLEEMEAEMTGKFSLDIGGETFATVFMQEEFKPSVTDVDKFVEWALEHDVENVSVTIKSPTARALGKLMNAVKDSDEKYNVTNGIPFKTLEGMVHEARERDIPDPEGTEIREGKTVQVRTRA